jgi:hypothetical protein
MFEPKLEPIIPRERYADGLEFVEMGATVRVVFRNGGDEVAVVRMLEETHRRFLISVLP